MLVLETPLKITDEIALAPNLTQHFGEVDLQRISNCVWEGFQADKDSRTEWERRTAIGMDLAMQIVEEKSFPWPDCANVAFPLVTIAALQFHARAYPAIVSGGEVVKCRALGYEPTSAEVEQAGQISKYMNYQLLEENTAWEEGQDRLLLNYSIVGCAFKKSYYSALQACNLSELVLAQDLVLDYFARSVETARRKSHVYPIYRNELLEGIRLDKPKFRDISKEPWFSLPATSLEDEKRRDGTTAPQSSTSTPFTAIEQHCWLDLDQDGYEEPYIVTIEAGSQVALRIVARWERPEDIMRNSRNQVYSIRATEHFTKYGFIPSPDGSIYDMGFGALLGPLNESVSSAINQLLDAGTMANGAGGFLGRGAKIRGGVYTFSPFEWKRVDSTGDDLRKSIFPIPVREPSAVLFNLLSLLIDYTNRISGATESMVGENPGQNTPAETSRAMIEQGMKVYAAIFKRTWRAMKEEFKKLFILNALYAPTRYQHLFKGDPNRIQPAADPNIASESERMQRAFAVANRAATVPGYDPAAVEELFLTSLKIEGWKRLYRGVDPAKQPKDPRIQIEEMRHQREMLKMQQSSQEFAAQLLEERTLNQAEIIKTQAEVVKILAQAEDARDNREIVRMQTALAALKTRDEALRARVDQLLKIMELESEPDRKRVDTGEIRRMAGAPGDGGLVPPLEEPTGTPEGGMG
jgi:chaperonin GroES